MHGVYSVPPNSSFHQTWRKVARAGEFRRRASNMRLLIILLCFYVPLECGARTIMVPFTSGEPIALSKEQLPQLFSQCSRSAPHPTEILGVPTKEEIRDLELRLERYIAEIYEAGKPAPPSVTFARQYVAYRVGGNRKIYGNFFPDTLVCEHSKGQATVVCDGGPAFWGIVYDPLSKQFEQFEMNGPNMTPTSIERDGL